MNDKNVEMGRLALRREGENWNAYYALPNTMEGAVFLGSIRMGAVIDNESRKHTFMALMQDIVADIIEDKTGHRPTFATRPAPMHERAGHG